MVENVSQAEWDAIDDDHKTVEPDGQRYILRVGPAGSTLVAVRIEYTTGAAKRRTTRSNLQKA